MNKEIISALLPAAMLGDANGAEDSFGKMSVNIDRVLRSDFMRYGESNVKIADEKPHMIIVDKDTLRDDKVVRNGDKPICASLKYEEPYVVVPRVVGNE